MPVQDSTNYGETQGQGHRLMAVLIGGQGLAAIWTLPQAVQLHGGLAFICVWLFCAVVVALPLILCEMGLASCLQNAIPEALRRAWRDGEWVGWWGVIATVLVAVVAGVACAWALAQAMTVTVAALTASPVAAPVEGWRPDGTMLAGVVLAWWWIARGLRCDAPRARRREGLLASAAALLLIVPVIDALLARPAGSLLTQLQPDWSHVALPATWATAVVQVMLGFLPGLGLYAAVIASRERVDDCTAPALLVLAGGAIGQFLLLLATCAVLSGGRLGPAPLFALEHILVADQVRRQALGLLPVLLAVACMQLLLARLALRSVLRAWEERFGAPSGRQHLRLVMALALLGMLASAGDRQLLPTLLTAMPLVLLLPLAIALPIVLVRAKLLRGLLDHLRAYSMIRPGHGMRRWLVFVLPPFLLFCALFALIDLLRVLAAQPAWGWMSLLQLAALGAAPLLAWRLPRYTRQDAGLARVVLLAWVLTLVIAALPSIVAISRQAELMHRQQADVAARALFEERSWPEVDHPGHPLRLLRQAWRQGRIDDAQAVLRMLRLRPLDTPAAQRVRAAVVEEIGADARRWCRPGAEAERRHRVLQAAAMLEQLGALAVRDEVHRAMQGAAWFSPEAMGRLAELIQTMQDGQEVATPALLHDFAMAWQGLSGAPGSIPLMVMMEGPEPLADLAAKAMAALYAQVALVTEPGVEVQREAWQALVEVLGQTGIEAQLGPRQRRLLADRYPEPAASGVLVIVLLIANGLLALLGYALHLAMLRRRAIDPLAETLEHVDPVDIDTQAVTIDDSDPEPVVEDDSSKG